VSIRKWVFSKEFNRVRIPKWNPTNKSLLK
jgi:hypothetical protein